MSTENVDRSQQEMRNFLSLLPLTVEIAGLPKNDPGKYYNADQMEVRANTLRTAYKAAKKLVREIAKDPPT